LKKIPLFRPRFNVARSLSLIEECLEKGWTGMGYRTEQFEAAWSNYTGVKYSHYLNSSTSGLNLAVEILSRMHQWPDDAQLITTPLTFVSTNHAILHAGFQPVFADCDETGCLTVQSISDCISPLTRCVVFVGLGGSFGELPQIAELCKSQGICLIVDAAHMAGSTHRSHHPCHYGDITVYSFQAVKNLPTADSGMLCSNNEFVNSLARRLSWLGIDKDTYQRSKEGAYKWDYDVPELGYKYHGNSIVASIALAQLDDLDVDNAMRRQIVSWYKSVLDPSLARILEHTNENSSSRHLFQIDVPRRDELMIFLSEQGISTGVHYKDNTLYPMYKYCLSAATSARSLWSRLVTLPCHVDLTENDVDRIGSLVNQFLLQ